MYKNVFQNKFVTVFYSCGSKPLAQWSKYMKTGFIRRITDEEIKSLVLEIISCNIVNSYITTPPLNFEESLAVKLPFMIMIIKHLKKYFSFEITILDDRDMKRRFRISNYQKRPRKGTFVTYFPIELIPGWQQVKLNLAEFTKRAYDTCYVETVRLTVHANCRLRRIYFSDKLYDDEELPQDYRIFKRED